MNQSPARTSTLVILLRKSWDELRNAWRTRHRHSTLKLAFIALFMAGFTAGLWALFSDGFRFMDTLGGVGLLVVNRLFALFFFGLGCMLVLSATLAAYSSFFRSSETDFLITLPVQPRALFAYKFFQASILASWAFFFIIIPFVGAYAQHEHLSWAFSLWTLVFSIPFVLLCCALGSIITLIFVRIVPRGRRWIWVILAGAGVAAAVLSVYFLPALRVDAEATIFLSRLIPGLRLASFPLLPSFWLSEGIMSLSRGLVSRGVGFWVVLASNAVVAFHLYLLAADRLFMAGLHRIRAGAGRLRRRAVLLSALERAARRLLPSDFAGIILKDVRCFLRDPAQWGQSLFFFGLLALYFFNLRNLHYHTLPLRFRNLIVFLNVFSIATVMASFASRFIYPQLSLEGQSFWVLGLAPTTLTRVLLAKFTLAAAASCSLALGLMKLCVRMLQVEPLAARASIWAAAGCALAMAALATGLGAVFMDLRNRNPTAIVSGLGGTVTLLCCLGFIAAGLFPLGFVYHYYGAAGPASDALRSAVRLALGWLAVITVVATVAPLVAGVRALRRREF